MYPETQLHMTLHGGQQLLMNVYFDVGKVWQAFWVGTEPSQPWHGAYMQPIFDWQGVDGQHKVAEHF